MSRNFWLTNRNYWIEKQTVEPKKKGSAEKANPLKVMVGTLGFEPRTSTVSG